MTADRRSIGIVAAGFATFINLYATQAILSVLAAEFGVGLPRTGWTVTAPLLAVAGVAPFVGSISDRLGRKRLIVAAAVALVVPTTLLAAAPSLQVFVLLRFVQGLLLPFIFTVTVGYIGDECEGADVIRLTGTYAVGTIIGGFFGRFVLGYATEFAGWRSGFVLLGVLTACAAAIVALLLPRERRFRPQHGFSAMAGAYVEHLSNRRLAATYAVGFAVLFSIVTAFTYANFVLAAPPYRFGPAALGNVFIVYLLAIFTTPAATRMAARLGNHPTLIAAVAIGAAGMLLTLLHAAAAIIAGLALAIAGMFIEQVLATGYIGVAARRARSTAVGLYVSFYYVGGSLGGIVPAGIWHWAGWPGCVGLVVVVQVLMLAIALAFWHERGIHNR
jgi:YNFM family putative membrane transporter